MQLIAQLSIADFQISMAMEDNEHQGDKKEISGAYITKRGQNMRSQDEPQNVWEKEWVSSTAEEK